MPGTNEADEYAALLDAEAEAEVIANPAAHARLAEELLATTDIAKRVAAVTLRQPLPDGAYATEVAAASLGRVVPDDQSSALQLKWQLRIIAGEWQGRFLWATINVGQRNQTADHMIRQQMEMLGLQDFREFLNVLPQLAGVRFTARVKTTTGAGEKQYHNVYLNQREDDGIDVPALARAMGRAAAGAIP